MGQYWKIVNLDKKEFVMPHRLGTGLKLWEQLANHPGTGAALVILCAAMPDARGGGDFDLDSNWHGPERDEAMKSGTIDGCTPGPMPEEYPAIAKRTIGRWAGDRIALVGDYGERGDIQGAKPMHAGLIYGACLDLEDGDFDFKGACDWYEKEHKELAPEFKRLGQFKDVSDDVAAVIEHELQGKYVGDGWRSFKYDHAKEEENA